MQRGFHVWLGLLAGLAACQSDPNTTQPPAAAAAPAATTASASAGWAGKVDSLTAAQLPRLEKLPGQLLQAWRWTDALGENVLVVYRTKPVYRTTPDTDMEGATVQLFARQYVLAAGGQYQELWRLRDGIEDCPFDLDLGPLPGSTRITDLDADGQTETTLVYKLACRSDVSPSDLKLIMHEGKAKYALRGFTVVQYDSVPVAQRMPANPCCLDTISAAELDEHYELNAGRYENEKDFRGAPRAFLGFARAHWRHWAPRDLDTSTEVE
ncbi:M949_RS01915 family surface polysaccharide biosynthesis protein [Hymenobacter sp. CRA2]|uniref:M949_RS01915 family surface polysaccharide biosynthesis protein n=1 Tax=Hymenobacter sp. CRA2 TaxID=1955620 RepID=UPI00098F45C4|nr:hypothetical protein [Hymenobacter sp. CRA2]OON70669.1 hypothetical protein B0919_01230 [Hymenobacter sp. CRA2]